MIFRTVANKRLKKEIQRRDAIYLLIGHDLSSPIVAMGDTLNQIESNLGPLLSSTQKSYLYMLKTKIQGAYLLLLNLLQWYKTEIQQETDQDHIKIANIKSNVDIGLMNNRLSIFCIKSKGTKVGVFTGQSQLP